MGIYEKTDYPIVDLEEWSESFLNTYQIIDNNIGDNL